MTQQRTSSNAPGDCAPDVLTNRSALSPFEDPGAIGIVHDLGNLIQVAASAVSLLARRQDKGEANDTGLLLSGAKTALERAGAIVRETLHRARTGARVLDHVNVTACLAEIGRLVHPMLNQTTRLHIRTNSDTLAITASRLALQNAVLNLVLNARDAMPEGGLISIEAQECYDKASGAAVEISVCDTGIGMPPETMDRIFEPYYSTKPNGAGGVGMSMVKHFVESTGGTIGIASAPGSGTTITLRLPAATILSAALSAATDMFRA
jgi:signal transduction histidine kinase